MWGGYEDTLIEIERLANNLNSSVIKGKRVKNALDEMRKATNSDKKNYKVEPEKDPKTMTKYIRGVGLIKKKKTKSSTPRVKILPISD